MTENQNVERITMIYEDQKVTRIISFLDERLVHDFGFGPRRPRRSSKE